MSYKQKCGCEVLVYGGHGMATEYEVLHSKDCTFDAQVRKRVEELEKADKALHDYILDRKTTAYGNMEGCDPEEFIHWEARYVAMCELLDARAAMRSSQ